MIDWREYWDDFPRRFNDDEFRRQVGRTANRGVPTPEPELETVVAEIASSLELAPQDRLLDLCNRRFKSLKPAVLQPLI